MNVLSVHDNKEMSMAAARIIIARVRKKPDAVLGLATGGTPEGTYQALLRDYQENKTSYQKARTVNLDEYVGLDPNHPNSYHRYMKDHFFKHIDIPNEHCFIPDGQAVDLEAECRHYDHRIEQLGGVDLQLLGIGRNGHIGFNEPGTSFDTGTHVVSLTESTRTANARYFEDERDVPDRAITMGIGTIMKSKEIVLIASGETKAEAVSRLLDASAPDPDFPATALKNHPHVTVIADQAALSLTVMKARHS